MSLKHGINSVFFVIIFFYVMINIRWYIRNIKMYENSGSTKNGIKKVKLYFDVIQIGKNKKDKN